MSATKPSGPGCTVTIPRNATVQLSLKELAWRAISPVSVAPTASATKPFGPGCTVAIPRNATAQLSLKELARRAISPASVASIAEVASVACDAAVAGVSGHGLRLTLLALADSLVVGRVHVHQLADDEMTLLAAIGPEGWRAFLLAVDDTGTRRAGKVPPGDTAAILCVHCGPVYVHPSVAAVLPVVAGWPRALGCPWCHIRQAGGYIPRPGCTTDLE